MTSANTLKHWQGYTIYQIYPRSFYDNNGDGIGDLPGITKKLDYIANLGVDMIWISPFFQSPMKDFGYDVSNYCEIAPEFGTMADFDALIAAANAKGLRIMIDLVLSHTSDQHIWFTESRQNTTNAKHDWYVWADPNLDGTPPNNWLSIFGGSAWQYDGRRRQYYLHNFLTSQPDLNFHNPLVRKALLEIADFWLQRGVGGFRLDTVNFYFHDQQLRNNPPLPMEKRKNVTAPQVNPYTHQSHIYSKNRPENLDFLADFRQLLNRYNAIAVGEVGDDEYGLEIANQYTRGNTRLHMCYSFDFLSGGTPSIERIADIIQQEMTLNNANEESGWTCWAYSNHDVMRHATRWATTDGQFNAQLYRLYCTLLFCLRGTICMYQGEELGYEEDDIAFEDLQDPYGIEFWPEFTGRDGCRTPIVWETNEYANNKPSWLPVQKNIDKPASAQTGASADIRSHYQQMIALRKQHPALQFGRICDISVNAQILSFQREWNDESIFCAFNFGDTPVEAEITNAYEPLFGSTNIPAFQSFIARANHGIG